MIYNHIHAAIKELYPMAEMPFDYTWMIGDDGSPTMQYWDEAKLGKLDMAAVDAKCAEIEALEQRKMIASDPAYAMQLAAQNKIDVDLAKEAALKLAAAFANRILSDLTSGYSELVTSGWQEKGRQAKACLDGEPPENWIMIATEAGSRMPPKDLAAKIYKKAVAYQKISSQASAFETDIRAGLAGATDAKSVAVVLSKSRAAAEKALASILGGA